MSRINMLGIFIPSWIIIPIAFLVWVAVLFFLKKLLLGSVRRLAGKTATSLDDILVQSLDLPLTLLIVTSGGAVTERVVPLTTHAEATVFFPLVFKAVTIVAVILFVDKFFNALLRAYAHKVDILKSSGGIARGFVRIAVIGLGSLVLLDSFGVSITPVLASLGIGSLAVALALQPTLENLFAGIQIVIDRPIQLGHFIRLESGEEGYVHRIGWRSTWVKMLPNNIVVIPNKALVNSKIINYYYPDTELAVVVEVGVHYGSDLERVERVTTEVARETLRQVPGGVADFAPFIRYHTFDDFSINFTVVLRVKEFSDTPLIKHEFIKRLHKRYAQEGIVIPYPIHAVNHEQEKAFEKKGTEED